MGSQLILDASPMLAVAFEERHLGWVADQLSSYPGKLSMCTVNATEVLIKFYRDVPHKFHLFEKKFMSADINFVPADLELAKRAAEIRVKFHINLGDAFVVALAEREKATILTIDADFKKINHVKVLMP